MKDLLAWWFFPKRLSSIIKILIGLLICYGFFDALIRNSIDLIDAFINPPLYLGTSYLLLPIISALFTKAILWSGLLYLPYYIFGKRSEGIKRYLMPILLVALIIGSGFAGAFYTKPGSIEINRTQLALLEARLGERQLGGDYYTVREFGYDIARLTKFSPDYTIPIPDYLISEAEGFSKLVLFYKDCEKEWKEYDRLPLDKESTIALVSEELYGSDGYWLAGVLWSQNDELPNTSTSGRTKYRLEHPDVDASLIFWGKSTQSVFYKGSKEGDEVVALLKTWFDKYSIDKYKHPHWANWTLPPK